MPFPMPGPRLIGVPGGYSLWPQSITAPASASFHPPASPGQAAAASFPTLAPLSQAASLWKHLALGRAARTEASWPYFLMKERAHRRELSPHGHPTRTPTGTLALFALWHRWAPSGVSLAGAGVGALQGVAWVAREAYAVPSPVDVASSRHALPIPDVRGRASDNWKRETRSTMFRQRARRSAAQPSSLSCLQRVQWRCRPRSLLNQNGREAAWITEQIFALDMGTWKEGEMLLTGNSPCIAEQRTTAPYPELLPRTPRTTRC